MKISYATHQSIDVNINKPTVIATNNPTVYYEFISALSDESDNIKILDDAYNELLSKTAIDWVGDVMLNTNLNIRYNHLLLKQLEKSLGDNQRRNLYEMNNKLMTTVQQILFMTDLPLEVNLDWDVQKLLKYCEIHYDSNMSQSPSDIIRLLLKTHLECNLSSVIGLTNVAHYLDQDKMADVSTLVSHLNIPLIMVEFTDLSQKPFYQNCDFYFIDKDFIDWH